jgi:hypothetical protein
MLARGEKTGVVATRFGLSAARISQLRTLFETSWLRLQDGLHDREVEYADASQCNCLQVEPGPRVAAAGSAWSIHSTGHFCTAFSLYSRKHFGKGDKQLLNVGFFHSDATSSFKQRRRSLKFVSNYDPQPRRFAAVPRKCRDGT